MKLSKTKIGEISYTVYNTPMKIIEYKNNTNVIIEFQDKYKIKKRCTYQRFKEGRVHNPYDKSLYGIGFIGEINEKDAISYEYWHSMLNRCYGKRSYYNSYKEITVCDEWLCYANFKKWFDKNYYKVKNERMEIDKDIILKNNKIYSPNTCIFVPQKINNLFISINKKKAIYKNKSNTYYYYKRDRKRQKNILVNNFKTYEEAYKDYKKQKEINIKKTINEYKNLLPLNIFNILNNYIIE